MKESHILDWGFVNNVEQFGPFPQMQVDKDADEGLLRRLFTTTENWVKLRLTFATLV